LRGVPIEDFMSKLRSAIGRLFRPSILQKALVLVFVPLSLNCIWIYMLNSTLARTGDLVENEHKLSLIVDQLNSVQLSFYATLSDTYALAMTGKENFRDSAMIQVTNTRNSISTLKKLLADTPQSIYFFNNFDQLIERSVVELNATSTPDPDAGYKVFLSRAVGLRKMLRQLMHNGGEMQTMLATFKQKLEEMRVSESNSRAATQALIRNGLIANFLLALLLLVLFIRNFGKRLSTLIDNATRLPKRLPLNEQVSGGDELSYLDDAMHVASHDLMQAWNHRDALVAMVAHDLRSPLSSCEISLELLQEIEGANLSAEGNSQINNIRSNISRLIALINDLLTISKLEAGELKLDKKVVATKEMIDVGVAALNVLAQSKQIEIENLCGDEKMLADRDRILQVVINYLSNAIKFSPRRSRIKIFCNTEGNRLTVSVQDQGRGLTKAESREVFKKFYQAKTDESVKGFGLGLAICKLIIECHDGLIGVESVTGKGSRFWFSVDAVPESLTAI